MRIIIFTLFFLVALLTSLAFFNTSQLIHDNAIEIWNLYDDNNTSVIGIFTLFGTILTAFVFFVTAKATKNASDSVSLARDSLSLSEVNNKKDEFLRRFSMLLEQHNNHLDIVKEYLDKNNNFTAEVMGLSDHLQAFNKLRGHEVISPYMRILYHLLKHISVEFYIDEKSDPKLKERKKFSSLIRSLIRNDVLSLIAVNSSYIFENGEYNQYKDYQILLKKFDFFQHVNFFTTTSTRIDHDDIYILESEFEHMYDGIIKGYCDYSDNYNFLKKRNNGPERNNYKHISPSLKIKTCVIVSIIFNNKTNRLAISLYIDLIPLLEKKLRFHDIVFFKENNKSAFIKEVVGCYIGIIPTIFNSPINNTYDWDRIRANTDYYDHIKSNSVLLDEHCINNLYHNFLTKKRTIQENEFIFGNGGFFLSHSSIENRLKKITLAEEIMYSTNEINYKKFRLYCVMEYNEKIKSILSQSISLDD